MEQANRDLWRIDMKAGEEIKEVNCLDSNVVLQWFQ